MSRLVEQHQSTAGNLKCVSVPGATQCGHEWRRFGVKCELPKGHELTPCFKHVAREDGCAYCWMVDV